MGEPLAYLLTWRTYGTWLHGDPRASVDWQHNVFGEAMLAPSPLRTEHAHARMVSAPVLLTDAARQLVAQVISRHCAIRAWELHGHAVRESHVHVVVGYALIRSEPMLSQFKAYATRALREAGLFAASAAVWAEGGSTTYLWTPPRVNGACDYVRDGQDVPR